MSEEYTPWWEAARPAREDRAPSHPESHSDRLDRRQLLRRGGCMALGLVTVAGLQWALAPPAEAAGPPGSVSGFEVLPTLENGALALVYGAENPLRLCRLFYRFELGGEDIATALQDTALVSISISLPGGDSLPLDQITLLASPFQDPKDYTALLTSNKPSESDMVSSFPSLPRPFPPPDPQVVAKDPPRTLLSFRRPIPQASNGALLDVYDWCSFYVFVGGQVLIKIAATQPTPATG